MRTIFPNVVVVADDGGGDFLDGLVVVVVVVVVVDICVRSCLCTEDLVGRRGIGSTSTWCQQQDDQHRRSVHPQWAAPSDMLMPRVILLSSMPLLGKVRRRRPTVKRWL